MWLFLLLVRVSFCITTYTRYQNARFPDAFQISIYGGVHGGITPCWSKCTTGRSGVNGATSDVASVRRFVTYVLTWPEHDAGVHFNFAYYKELTPLQILM